MIKTNERKELEITVLLQKKKEFTLKISNLYIISKESSRLYFNN